jgi:transcription elongation GreA/GreB family factor
VSRTVVKDPAEDQVDILPDRDDVSAYTQYTRSQAPRKLKASGSPADWGAALPHIERGIRYFEDRERIAPTVGPTAPLGHGDVRFGATLWIMADDNQEHDVSQVREDESCATQRLISRVSPLASMLVAKAKRGTVIGLQPS